MHKAPSFHGRHFKLMGQCMSRSFRCLWMLEELGIPYEHDPARPQARRVRALHPLGKIPLLVETRSDDETPFVLTESTAINTYLGDWYNSVAETSLVPRSGTSLRGRYDMTISCLISELDSQALWIHRKHESLGQYFGHIPEAVEHAKGYFEKVNSYLANQIVDTPHEDSYLLGPTFTAADVTYVHCLDWSKSIGWDDSWKDDERLCRYIEICKARPSYQRVLALQKAEMQQIEKKNSAESSKL